VRHVRLTGCAARACIHRLRSRALPAALPARVVSGAGVEGEVMEGEAEVTFANASVNGIASVPGNALLHMYGVRYHP
jgi:hypothetical protein